MDKEKRVELENKRRREGKLYQAGFLHDQKWIAGKITLEKFNQCGISDMEKVESLLKEILASVGERSMIIPPFYISQGKNTSVGKHFFANAGLTILDEGSVTIGDNVYIGPGVSIFTPIHPIDIKVRNTGLQMVKNVVIKDNVWIAGNVTINPGVTIGEGSVIGSGSVVTKDIEAGVIAAGNPCKVIRVITDDDHEYWEKEYQAYLEETK